MIKRIELTNFLSHEQSVFELAEGLNVLVGPNNCGKSAVVTALQVLCYNDNSMYVRRHGAPECSVLVETDDGHVIRWSRKKSGSPVYEIDGETFDRLGKGKVPDRLHEVLRMPRVESEKDEFDVHFGEQRNPTFLLNDSPRAAADFFASSSDAIRLVEMQTLHKQNVRDARSEHKRLKQETVELTATLKSLKPIDDVSGSLTIAEQHWCEMQAAEEQIIHAEILVRSIRSAELASKLPRMQLAGLDSLPSPPPVADISVLQEMVQDLEKTHRKCRVLRRRSDVLKPLVSQSPTENPDTLEAMVVECEDLQHDLDYMKRVGAELQLPAGKPTPLDDSDLRQLTGSIARQIDMAKELTANIKEVDRQLAETGTSIKDWTIENPFCPSCGGQVTAEQLLRPGGHQHEIS